MKQMQIFTAVGPLGAGKTTFFLNLIQALESQGFSTKDKIAYVVNDEGALVDGDLARQRAQVVAMTNGCFTCSDSAELRRTLENLEQSGISWVFLEGFGITAGNETKDFLESCPYRFHILCLLSLKHYELDLIRYSDVVRSHVGAATIAVGITKFQQFGESLLTLRTLAGIPEIIASENAGIPLTLIPDSSNLPKIVLDIFAETEKSSSKLLVGRRRQHVHHAGCGCDHEDHHHHIHEMYSYSFNLLESTTLEDIKKVFSNKKFILRIKGAVNGYLYNEVHGDWRASEKDDRNFVTFYSQKEVDIERNLPELLGLIVPKSENQGGDQGYQRLRMETVTRDETVRAIKDLLEEITFEPVIHASGRYIRVITHPENLQLLKEISRRPYVKDEWFPIVLKRCMEYWVKCAEVVRDRRKEILPDDLGKNLRELGVSMSWWVNRYGDYFGPEISGEVEKLYPGAMVAEGILAMKSLNSDSERASWEAAELSEALSYGISHGDDCVNMVSAACHCMSLAGTFQLQNSWIEIVRKLIRESDDVLV